MGDIIINMCEPQILFSAIFQRNPIDFLSRETHRDALFRFGLQTRHPCTALFEKPLHTNRGGGGERGGREGEESLRAVRVKRLLLSLQWLPWWALTSPWTTWVHWAPPTPCRLRCPWCPPPTAPPLLPTPWTAASPGTSANHSGHIAFITHVLRRTK